jgi:glycine reductase
MRLEVGTFPVKEVHFGASTRLHDGILEINRNELLELVLQDERIPWASIDVARPGEPVRVINLRDMFEPKVKVEGPGMVYPGICGRPIATVGQGKTYRLANVAVMLCLDTTRLTHRERTWPHEPPARGTEAATARMYRGFVDMSGPGNLPPYDSLNLVCVTIEAPPGIHNEDRHIAIYSAALRVADRLAESTVGLQPPELEVFDTTKIDPSLPGMVFIPHLASGEWQAEAGPRSAYGTAVYGQTRLSAPWLLYPTEMIDGAVCGTYINSRPATWHLSNNPIVIDLARRHGKTCNFLGCIIQRTNWTGQLEKEMAASRAALLSKRLGANGAIVTTDLRGQRFLETALTVRACEREGIKTVLLTEEEDNEEGTAPPLLVSFPEIVAVVSSGSGGQERPFPPVKKVIGAKEIPDQWHGELPAIHGSYGSNFLADYYGFGYQSFEDY